MPSSGASSSTGVGAARRRAAAGLAHAGRWPGWPAASARNSCCRRQRARAPRQRPYDAAARGRRRRPARAPSARTPASSRRWPRAMPGGALGQQRWRGSKAATAAGGNALRAAVLGANDGLVSNLSLVMGVAGAEVAGQHDPVDRPRRAGRRRLLDGDGRMAVGHQLARTATSGRSPVEADELAAHARGRKGGDGADLPGQGARRAAGARARRPADGQQGHRARHAGARGARASTPRSSAARPGPRPAPRSCCSRSARSSRWRRSSCSAAPRRCSPAWRASGVALLLIGAGTSLFTGRSAGFSGAAPAADRLRRRRRHLRHRPRWSASRSAADGIVARGISEASSAENRLSYSEAKQSRAEARSHALEIASSPDGFSQ